MRTHKKMWGDDRWSVRRPELPITCWVYDDYKERHCKYLMLPNSRVCERHREKWHEIAEECDYEETESWLFDERAK